MSVKHWDYVELREGAEEVAKINRLFIKLYNSKGTKKCQDSSSDSPSE